MPALHQRRLDCSGAVALRAGTSGHQGRAFDVLEMEACARKGERFAFETTLAGLVHVGRIGQWREQGYHVSLFFLRLPDAETAIARVAERVLQGGHDIPEDVSVAVSPQACTILSTSTRVL